MDSFPRRAFTLCDAVASAACLAALGAVATAALSASTRADLAAQDQANLMTIGGAAAAWSADHQGLIVGAPGASARQLLNDPTGQERPENSIFTKGLATQPFDWASPIAWGYLTDAPAPQRRDARLAYALGVEPKLVDPDAGEPIVADSPPPGPLAVLSDPAQRELSRPYADTVSPEGVSGTFFAVQTAASYTAAREFLWWGQGASSAPRWADPDTFWGDAATFRASATWSVKLPGVPLAGASGSEFARDYRPYTDRVGAPSKKIFLANGTRYQAPGVSAIDHDIDAHAGHGGAFADTGAWSSDPAMSNASRAWPEGTNGAGQDMTRVSFRHGDETTPRGNVLRFDGSVELMDIDDARDPSLWLPRGSSVRAAHLPESYRDLIDENENLEFSPGAHPFLDRVITW